MKTVARRLKVQGPATLEELEAAYKASQDPHDQERLLAIRMAQQGSRTLEQIGSRLNRGPATFGRRFVRELLIGLIGNVAAYCC